MNAQQIADAIRALESLRQEGLLSEDEFAREKSQLLKQLRTGAAARPAEPPSVESSAQNTPPPTREPVGAADFFSTGGPSGPDAFMTGATPKPVESFSADISAQPYSEHTPIPEEIQANPASKELNSGALLRGRYEIRRLLGQGGMGVVYLVFDRVREREIALKQIHPHLADDDEIKKRFVRELQINEHLTHPGIVRTYAIDEDPSLNLLFFTMEYVKGHSLEKRLAAAVERSLSPPIPLKETCSLLRKLAEVLDYAHKQGVIHRDLKPGNVLLPDQGGIKLMDFGIAKIITHEHTHHHTGFVGTVYYMAPEQLKGGVVSAATDIYSLGILTYQMLTGEIYQGGMPGPSELVESLPTAIDEVIRKSIFWKPEGRYQSASEFADAVESALFSKTHASSSPSQQENKPFGELFQLATQSAASGIADFFNDLKKASTSSREEQREELRQLQLMVQVAHERGTLDAKKQREICERARKIGLESEIKSLIEQLQTSPNKAPQRAASKGMRQLRTFDRHDDWLTACAFAPDGLEVATCGWDRKIRFWDTGDGKQLDMLARHQDVVSGCAYAPDGNHFLSIARDGSLIYWDLDEGEVVSEWKSRTVSLSGVRWMPDGKRAVTSSWDHTLQLWYAPSGRLLHTFVGARERVLGCEVVGDDLIASFDAEGVIMIWSSESMELVTTLSVGQHLVTALAYSPELQLLAGCTDGGDLITWNVQGWSEHSRFAAGAVPLTCCVFAQDGALFVGDEEGNVRLWQLDERRVLAEAFAHEGGVTACDVDRVRGVFASAGADRQCHLWEQV